MDEMKKGRTTWLDGRIVIHGKEKKAARESRKQRGKEGLSVTGPPGIPVLERLKQRDSRLTWATQNSSSVKNGGGGNHCLVE